MDLDKYMINLNNHADARRVVSANYPPWLLRDLHNFSYHMKAGSNSCFSFYSKYFDNSAYLDLCEVPPSEHLLVFLGNFRIWRDVSSGTSSSKSSCHPLNGSFAGILVFFKALTQLFCLRFTIEIFCHFLQLWRPKQLSAVPPSVSFSVNHPKRRRHIHGYPQTSSKVGKH